jgi:hypothetical protein
MKLVNFRVKPSLWDEIAKVAEGRGLRQAEAVREALTEYVQRNYKYLAPRPDVSGE